MSLHPTDRLERSEKKYLQILPKKILPNLGPNTSDLGNLRLQFENKIVIFEISTLEFV